MPHFVRTLDLPGACTRASRLATKPLKFTVTGPHMLAKTLIAHLDWGLGVKEAIAAPNIYFGGDAIVVEANTPLAAKMTELAGFGRMVVTNGRMSSKANAAQKTAEGWVAAGDPRSEGVGLTE